MESMAIVKNKAAGRTPLAYSPSHNEVASCLPGMLDSSGAFVVYPLEKGLSERREARSLKHPKDPSMHYNGVGTRATRE